MPRDPKYDILFEPIQIGPKTLKNRFYQVPHCIGAGSEKPGMQAYHRGMKAEGGWGAVLHRVLLDPSRVRRHLARLGADLGRGRRPQPGRDVRSRCTSSARSPGIELWYGGPHAPCMESRATPRGPSQIAIGLRAQHLPALHGQGRHRHRPADVRRRGDPRARGRLRHRLRLRRPRRICRSSSCRRSTTSRTDEYGGSFENRARFWRESLYKVREAVGDDCAIASRFAVDHLLGPISIQVGEDGARFVEYCDDLVDLWDFTVGDIAEWGQNAGPSRFFEENHEKPYTGQIKAGNHTNKPVVGVGRITNPDTMVAIIKSGQFDIIGAARAVDLGSVPAQEDRGGAARRHPRVHRLQPVHLALGDRRPADGLHAERDRRRGVPPRLAPGEVPSAPPTPTRACSWSAPGPAGMECAMVLGKRGMCRRAPRRGRQARSAAA